MNFNPKLLVTMAALVFGLSITTPAKALPSLGDIIDAVGNTYDKVVDTYDKVKGLPTDIESIFTEVVDIESYVDGLETVLQTVKGFAEDAANEARNAAADAEMLVTELENGVALYAADARALVQEATANLEWQVAALLEGRLAFLGDGCDGASSECYQFRRDLNGVVRAMADLNNALLMATPVNATVDLQEVTDLLDSMPGPALYPLYTAFSQQSAVSLPELESFLKEAAMTTSYLAMTLKSDNTCENILTERANFEYSLTRVQTISTYLFLIGKAVNAAAEIFELEGFGAAWGFAGGTVKVNVRQLVGTLLEGFGETGLLLADRGLNKLSECDTEVFRATVLTFIENSPHSRGRGPR